MQTLNHEQFLKRIIALSLLRSKDETRDHLCGVKLSCEDNIFTIEAINGHMGSRESFLVNDLNSIDKAYFFRTNDINLLKIAVKDFGKMGLNVSINEETSTMDIVNITINLEAAPQRFPDIKTIWPSQKEDVVSINFNPELLATIGKALRDSPRHANIKLSFVPGELEAIVVSTSLGREALLMPCRG